LNNAKVSNIVGLVIGIFVFYSCKVYKTSAFRYNYRFNENDELYIKSFQNNDSLSLNNIKDIKFIFS